MKSETRLDAAVFQLTPTRTRCDLIIRANGASEKIASGLLNPFLAHLKTAREQIAKGGYSLTLEPNPGADAPWFTRGTLERFVRFVSTPEILERVDTIESEILQICEAIDIQSSDNFYLNSVEEDQSESASAIVLYQPGLHPDPGGRWKLGREESKEQFLRVLESRKLALQNEQGMAFARAAAAGFAPEHVADLISFAECFGAKRMLKACLKFEELWRRKKEGGQRLEIDFHESEAMSTRSEIPSLSSLDVLLSPDVAKSDWAASNNENSAEKRCEIPGWSSQMPFYPYPYFLSQYPPHHVLPHCPVHSPFPPYPMPCYQNHPEPRSVLDQRPDPELNGRKGSSDLNGQQGWENAEKHLDKSDGRSCSSSESDSQDLKHSVEDEQEMNQREEVYDHVDWCIPRSLLPRNDQDDDDKYDIVDPGEEIKPPSDGIKKQWTRCDEYDLSLMMLPRGREGESDSYDPSKDDCEATVRSSAAQRTKGRMKEEKKNKVGSVLREKVNSSKLSSLAEAQARATKLRAFKADLQRAKREKEEEDQRRLEMLKKEREQRIAARSSRSPVTPKQKINRLPAKGISPGLTLPGKSNLRGPGRVDLRKQVPVEVGSRLTQSLSSLPDTAKRKEEALGAASQPKKGSQARRRMSEPKVSFGQYLSSSLQSTVGSGQTHPKNSAFKGSGGQRLSSPLRSEVSGGQTIQNSSASILGLGQHLSSSSGSMVKSGHTHPHNSSASKGSLGQRLSSLRPTVNSSQTPQNSRASKGSRGQRLSSPVRSTINNGQSPSQKSSASKGSGGHHLSSPSRSILSSGKTPPQNSSASIDFRGQRLSSPSKKTPAISTIKARSESTVTSSFTTQIKTKKITEENERDDGDAVSQMGNRFPQADATPPLLNEESQSSSSPAIMHEEKKIAAPAKESHGKSVRFSLADKPYLQDQHHRRATSMEEAFAVQNPKFGEALDMGPSTGRVKEREPFKGLKKLFKFGRKTGGDGGLETSSLHEEDQTTAASSSSSPAARKASRRFSILSSFRSKKSPTP